MDNKEILEKIKEIKTKPLSKYKQELMFYLLINEPKTISEIQRELEISYKETYRHISELIEDNLLQRNREQNKKHAPVNITLTEKGKEKIKKITGFDSEKTINTARLLYNAFD